jgi:hypothetical protein
MEYIKTLPKNEQLEQFHKLLEYFQPRLSRSEQTHEISNELKDHILKAFDDGQEV